MKILVALSGGVDSSVAAYTLKKEGHEIEGVYMILHNNPSYHENNIKKVKKIAEFLDIKYHILDLTQKFEKSVYKPFIQSYINGETPNPCVVCNKSIKFGELVEFSKKRGFDKLATGHYAGIKNGFICEAKDKIKDQSYFLCGVKKEYIPHLLFPLNEMLKSDLIQNASKIPALREFAKQKESHEICFVDTTYVDILKKYTDTQKVGNVLDKEGNIIGKHKGYMHYTIGQRRGFDLFVSHIRNYVTKINPTTNEITVGEKDDLKIDGFFVKDLNMYIDEKNFDATVKIRYKGVKNPCKVHIDPKTSTAKVELKEPLWALASGQIAAFYHDDILIAGAQIV